MGRAGLGMERAARLRELAGGLHTDPEMGLEFKTRYKIHSLSLLRNDWRVDGSHWAARLGPVGKVPASSLRTHRTASRAPDRRREVLAARLPAWLPRASPGLPGTSRPSTKLDSALFLRVKCLPPGEPRTQLGPARPSGLGKP